MKWYKKLIRKPRVQRTICQIAAAYIWFTGKTIRWTHYNRDIPEEFWQSGTPFILCFWHGRLLMIPEIWTKKQTLNMLISAHPDGKLIADTVSHLGIKAVAGSSSKGGMAAMKQMLSFLKEGNYVGITPDGPRGPYMKASKGAASIARLSSVPMIPVSIAVKRARFMNSWDRFMLAWPFSKGVTVWGKPVYVNKDDDTNKKTKTLEKEMVAITRRADNLVGRETPVATRVKIKKKDNVPSL